ncbi:unnamed protein product [Jaminaea pallidilutea]
MAKGLRSKSKLSARNIKRTDPRSDYAVIHAARLAATSGRLAKRNRSSIKAGDEDGEDDAMEADVRGEGEEEDAEGNAAKDMSEAAERGAQEGEVDKASATAAKKVSTSGTRQSRRETWRKAKGFKPKIGSKNGGRPKRRK